MAEQKTFTQRSEEVQEIIGKSPPWVIRTGIIMIGGTVVLLLIGFWFVKYPDKINAEVSIISSNPPAKIVAQSTGNIAELYIHDGELIKSGTPVAIIENTANTNDILYLEKLVQAIDTTGSIKDLLCQISLQPSMRVGEIQGDNADLYQFIFNYKYFLNNRFYSDKLHQLKKQVTFYDELNGELEKKDSLLEKQIYLERYKDSVNAYLNKQKIVSLLTYNDIQKGYIDQKLAATSNKSGFILNKLQQAEYEKNIAELKQSKSSEEQELIQKIKNIANKIRGQISNWKKKYLLHSPIDGKITFFKVWNHNQYVTENEPIFVITPQSNEYLVRASLPAFKAGKVKPGQKVLIKLREFPFDEFGLLRSKVLQKSEVTLDTNFVVTVQLTDGLRTNSGKNIPALPVLTGTAEIITDDKNVFQRIFSPLFTLSK
jgi:HlyD family secretion protein